MFFFKKKKLVVECFTQSESLAEVGIPKAARFFPDWWKDLPKSIDVVPDSFVLPNPPMQNPLEQNPLELNPPMQNPFDPFSQEKSRPLLQNPLNAIKFPTFTMKTCAGFLDLYKMGNIVPLWSEMIIEVDEFSYKWRTPDKSCPPIVQHAKYQFCTEKYKLNEKWRHAKFESPWTLRCSKDVKFLMTEPSYNQLNNDYGIKVLPGVIEFKYQNSLNVNTFIPARPRKIELDYLYPMAHLICLDSNYDVEFKSIQVSADEYGKLNRFSKHRPFFLNSFNKIKKCPFHNSK